MASAPSHALAALALGRAFAPPHAPPRFWILGALCAVIPDADSVGFAFGVRYGDLLGHRGLSHSLLFAALLAVTVVLIGFRGDSWRRHRLRLFAYFFLATVSHGLLDALTNGGLGVAFFSPFDTTRYFFPWRPIQVSPINIARFFNGTGPRVLLSECMWVWIPAALFYFAAGFLRKAAARRG